MAATCYNIVMSQIFNDPVDIGLDKDGVLTSFVWQKKIYQVTSFTVIKGRPAFSRLYQEERYRVETRQGLVCELVKKDGQWMLEQVWEYKGNSLF